MLVVVDYLAVNGKVYELKKYQIWKWLFFFFFSFFGVNFIKS